jgi:hypothetical protein
MRTRLRIETADGQVALFIEAARSETNAGQVLCADGAAAR